MEHELPVECEDEGSINDISQFIGIFDGEVVKPLGDEDIQSFKKGDFVLVFDTNEFLAWHSCIRTYIESLK